MRLSRLRDVVRVVRFADSVVISRSRLPTLRTSSSPRAARTPRVRNLGGAHSSSLFGAVVKIKKSKSPKGKDITKFKIRCSKYLYTLSVPEADKVEKLKQSLPPGTRFHGSHGLFLMRCLGLTIKELDKKAPAKKSK